MRKFDDSTVKSKFLHMILTEMYRQTFLDPEPITYTYKDVEITMRKTDDCIS